MKIVDAINLRNKLSKVTSLKGLELNYVIKKSIREITDSLVEVVEEEKRINAIVTDYATEAKVIYEKASTDEHGVINQSPLNGGMSYKTTEESKAWLPDAIAELEEKHKEALELNREENKKFATFLNETESDFVLKTVPKSSVPQDIDTENLDLIFDLITE